MIEIVLFIILLIFILIIVIQSLYIGISPMPSSITSSKKILEFLLTVEDEIIVDLGSGFGTLSIFLAKNLPNKRIIAYEISFLPYIISIFFKYLLNIKNLNFYRENFLTQDLKNKILVCYLFPKAMEEFETKILNDNIRTTILSSTFAFRKIKPKNVLKCESFIKRSIFVYNTQKYKVKIYILRLKEVYNTSFITQII